MKMIWDRLDVCNGAPEVVEDALFQRINSFSKISNRDYSKLHELSDLLMLLEAAKADGDLPGFQNLDTSRGINPFVQKLPFWSARKVAFSWIQLQTFPPFGVFVNSISQQAKIKNDTSLKSSGQEDVPPKADKTPWKLSRHKVSVHKTDRIYLLLA